MSHVHVSLKMLVKQTKWSIHLFPDKLPFLYFSDQMNGNFQSDKFTCSEEKSDHFAELSDVEERKIVCSLDLLQELIEGCCQEPGCILPVFVTTRIVGVTAILEWARSAGHKGWFCSSRKVR